MYWAKKKTIKLSSGREREIWPFASEEEYRARGFITYDDVIKLLKTKDFLPADVQLALNVIDRYIRILSDIDDEELGDEGYRFEVTTAILRFIEFEIPAYIFQRGSNYRLKSFSREEIYQIQDILGVRLEVGEAINMEGVNQEQQVCVQRLEKGRQEGLTEEELERRLELFKIELRRVVVEELGKLKIL